MNIRTLLYREEITSKLEVIRCFMVSETKIENSFPIGSFLIYGFILAQRLDRDWKGGNHVMFKGTYSFKSF